MEIEDRKTEREREMEGGEKGKREGEDKKTEREGEDRKTEKEGEGGREGE